MFGAIKLTTNGDSYKYKYSGYGIVFDASGRLSLSDSGLGKNVIIFGLDISSYAHIGNNKKDYLDSW